MTNSWELSVVTEDDGISEVETSAALLEKLLAEPGWGRPSGLMTSEPSTAQAPGVLSRKAPT